MKVDVNLLSVVSSLIQAATSVLLAVLTWRYVRLTKTISETSLKTVEQVLKQQRPAVVARPGVLVVPTPRALSEIELHLVNLGSGPAVDISVKFQPKHMQFQIVRGRNTLCLSGAGNDGDRIDLKLRASLASPVQTPQDDLAGVTLGSLIIDYHDVHGQDFNGNFELHVDQEHQLRSRPVA